MALKLNFYRKKTDLPGEPKGVELEAKPPPPPPKPVFVVLVAPNPVLVLLAKVFVWPKGAGAVEM